ncbi:MFS general substrate transporter [Xylariaceae sp. FL0804]|nr:MFS general substrate transporter [Xylariaceae sp. FL0804]
MSSRETKADVEEEKPGVDHSSGSAGAPAAAHPGMEIVPIEQEAVEDAVHIRLGWRSWLVVFITTWAIMAQVFVVTAAGSVLAFIVADLGPGSAALSGWVIQAPLLVQSVLSPVVGRLSDVLDRKLLAAAPPLVALAGAVVSARAATMAELVGGGVLIGTALATISVVQSIPSEVLPLKYRALANGFAYFGGTVGGLIGSIGAGAVTNVDAGGWRYIFWMQAAFHGLTTLGLLLFYWPPKTAKRMSPRDIAWACDPVGSVLFIASTTLTLLALDWAGGAYAWSDAHVAVPLSLGLALMLAFAVYEWKGRADGLVAHVFFRQNANFALSVFAFGVEGWIFYSAVNNVVPEIILELGFEADAWRNSIRRLTYNIPVLFLALPVTWYATRYKDLKSPIIVSFVFFLAVCICYATITPHQSSAQYGYGVLAACGQAGPLTLLPALVQFTAPHAHLATATGLAFSARAVGGAFGSAVLDAVANGHLAGAHRYASRVAAAAVGAGLPAQSVPELLAALASGITTTGQKEAAAAAGVPGADEKVWAAALDASHWQYAYAYNLAWASIIPFVVLAIVAVAMLKSVKELMTEKVEATVEHVDPAGAGA